MSARSKIVRDFSGQEVAIPYDPRDDAQHTTEPKYYVTAIADEDGHECDSCGVIPEWFTGWYGLVGEDEGGFIAYFSTLEAANAVLIAAAPETAAERDRLRQVNEVMLEALRAAHKHAHKALTAESNSYTDEANMLDVLAAAIAAAEGKW